MHQNIYTGRSKACFLHLILTALAVASGSLSASAQAFTEDFATVPPAGWAQQNLSTPIGSIPTWIQGDITVFPAQNGATNAYAGCSFNSVAGANTISNWLFTPMIILSNGDVLTFYTRKAAPAPTDFPDRMQVRMSTNGASVNVGASNTSVGDFTTLLLDINPTLVAGGYPTVWTQFTITISGLGTPVSGRFAFRYFVTNGGPSGTNGDYIGVDNVVFTDNAPLPVTLANFSGHADGDRNQLRWTTGSERNNSGFEVQRSTDGINYTALDFVKSQVVSGNSSTRLDYVFTDNRVNGINQYYRLRQVDSDGHSTISNIVLIKGDQPLALQMDGLYPNPASTVVNVLIAAPNEEQATVVITDIIGKTVIQQVVNMEIGSNTLPIDIGNLSAGTYLVRLVGSTVGESAAITFVKQ